MASRLSRIAGLWFFATALAYGQIAVHSAEYAVVADGLTALQRVPGILALIHVLVVAAAAFALFFSWPYRFLLAYLSLAFGILAGGFPPLWSPTPFQVGSSIWWAAVVAINLFGCRSLCG